MSVFSEINEMMQPQAAQGNVPGNNRTGITLAEVTSIKDPDHLGRVRCRMLSTDKDSGDLGWAFVATPYAGKDRGIFFLPNEKDVVLIAFESGDVRRPYVIGSIWGGGQDAPVKITEKNETCMIKTKQNNTITLNDKDKKESIKIETPGGHHMTLNDETGLMQLGDKDNKNNITVNSKQGTIEIKCSGKITLTAGKLNLTLDGSTGNVNLSGAMNFSVDSDQIKMQAKASAEIKSSGQTTVASDGITVVKGGMVKIN